MSWCHQKVLLMAALEKYLKSCLSHGKCLPIAQDTTADVQVIQVCIMLTVQVYVLLKS